jgi:hypothetical protein
VLAAISALLIRDEDAASTIVAHNEPVDGSPVALAGD